MSDPFVLRLAAWPKSYSCYKPFYETYEPMAKKLANEPEFCNAVRCVCYGDTTDFLIEATNYDSLMQFLIQWRQCIKGGSIPPKNPLPS